jgi:cobyrinic acid a,c-diamide synthase
MAALRSRGMAVAAAKVGPDFIDPGYHQVATGRPGRNLDEWISGRDALVPLAARAARGADILIVEGVMGLFDGASPGSGPESSTASVASAIEAPVVLTVDASSIGASVAALVSGYLSMARDRYGLSVAGVVLNRVGSAHHEALLRASLAGIGVPVMGVLRRDERLAWRDRHLGLIPVVEHRDDVARSVRLLAAAVQEGVDLEGLVRAARDAPRLHASLLPAATPAPGRATVAVAAGKAFSFAYADNLERLEESGAELAFFDPRTDPALPQGCSAIYAGGGFPETFASDLSDNLPLRESVASFWRSGGVVWAECGGMAWLSESLDGLPMCGVLPTSVAMTKRLELGYRTARQTHTSPLGPPGASFRGHEFHYSRATPPGSALVVAGARAAKSDGFVEERLMASYLHIHLGWDPAPAEAFVRAACEARQRLLAAS